MAPASNSLQELLTEKDVARITKRSVASVRRDRRLKKNCPFVCIGRSVRYRPSDVDAWLRSLAKGGESQDRR
jgi:predicted DNA-binding transcriptional regulator AlpA